MKQPAKRKRGLILTDKGSTKIWSAINSTFPDGHTFAAISEYTEPGINPKSRGSVSPDSVSKILNREAKADKSTIKNLFSAFGLSLEKDDSAFPPETSESKQEAMLHPQRCANATHPQAGIWIPKSRCRKVWGRETLAEEVLSRLNDPQELPILSLSGGAGYGKTEVAAEVAKAALDRHLFARVLWVKARETELAGDKITDSQRDEALNWNQFLDEIAHQLDGCPLERVRQRLKEEKRLIVLDNAETARVEDILAKLVEMLEPSRVLLTTRARTNLPFVGTMDIRGLEESPSYSLLRDEAEHRNVPALLNASSDRLQQVYQLSCGAPLALHFIVGRVLDDGFLEPVLSALEDASLDVEKFYEFSLKTAWERISDATKSVLSYIGDANAGVTWEELSGARQVPESEWNVARRELRRWYLIEDETDAKGNLRYNIHPWVRRSLRGGLVDKWEMSLSELEQLAKWKYGIS